MQEKNTLFHLAVAGFHSTLSILCCSHCFQAFIPIQQCYCMKRHVNRSKMGHYNMEDCIRTKNLIVVLTFYFAHNLLFTSIMEKPLL